MLRIQMCWVDGRSFTSFAKFKQCVGDTCQYKGVITGRTYTGGSVAHRMFVSLYRIKEVQS
jgi:hypothetical protein